MFNFASRPAQLYRALTFDLLGIPQDYLFRSEQHSLPDKGVQLGCEQHGVPASPSLHHRLACMATRHDGAHVAPSGPEVHNCQSALPAIASCRYKTGIERVTAADVQAAAQRRLHPGQQTIVVAGDAARLRPELERLGLPIEDLPLS